MHPQMSTAGCSMGVAVMQPFASFFLCFLPLGDHFHLYNKHVCFPVLMGKASILKEKRWTSGFEEKDLPLLCCLWTP